MSSLVRFHGNKVEMFEMGGEIYFNPYDVGRCLGLCDSAVRMAISKMNKNQAVKITKSIANKIDNLDVPTAGRLFLTESGVYKIVFKSNKPNADEFANWVTDEVLPSIRKTGKYETEERLQEEPKKLLKPEYANIGYNFASYKTTIEVAMDQDYVRERGIDHPYRKVESIIKEGVRYKNTLFKPDEPAQIIPKYYRGIPVVTIQDVVTLSGLSETTVRYHIKNIYQKLEVNNKVLAIKKAQELKLL